MVFQFPQNSHRKTSIPPIKPDGLLLCCTYYLDHYTCKYLSIMPTVRWNVSNTNENWRWTSTSQSMSVALILPVITVWNKKNTCFKTYCKKACLRLKFIVAFNVPKISITLDYFTLKNMYNTYHSLVLLT